MWNKNTSLLVLVIALVFPAIIWAGPILGPNNEQVKEQEVNAAYQTVAKSLHVLTALKKHGVGDAVIEYDWSFVGAKSKYYALAQTRYMVMGKVTSSKPDAFDWSKEVDKVYKLCCHDTVKRVFKREVIKKLTAELLQIYWHSESTSSNSKDEDMRHRVVKVVAKHTDEAMAMLGGLLQTKPPKGCKLSLKPTTLPMSIVHLYAKSGFEAPPSPIRASFERASADKGGKGKANKTNEETKEKALSFIGTVAPGAVARTSPVPNEDSEEKETKEAKGSEEDDKSQETKVANDNKTRGEKEGQLVAYIVSLKNRVDMLEKRLQEQYQKGPQRVPVYVIVPSRGSQSSSNDLHRMHNDLRNRLTQLQQQRQRPPVVISNYYTRRNYCHQQRMMYLQAVMSFIQAQRNRRSRRRS